MHIAKTDFTSSRQRIRAAGGSMISPRISLVVLFLIAGLGNSVRVLAADAPAAQQTPLPVALVDALNKLSNGPHKGFRANHAKGVVVAATFTPSPSAASFSKAPNIARSVPVLARFP